MQRSFGERIAMNSPIQGTAADIIKIAMIRVDQRLRKEKLRSRLVLQVHDELLIETWTDELEKVQKVLEEEMKNAAHQELHGQGIPGSRRNKKQDEKEQGSSN